MSLEDRIVAIAQGLVADDFFVTQSDGNDLWMVITGALVFFMHAGFAMLEAGSITKTSVVNIMFKNLATITIGVLFYWLVGFAFAYGSKTVTVLETSTFFGFSNFFGRTSPLSFWFFQMVFAATGATIVSGAVAGRIKLTAYFVIAIAIVSFIYPVVSHWIWAAGGWLSAFTDPADLFMSGTPCGTIDFAGSGVVHSVGGVAAFWGALIIGPRAGWVPGTEEFPAHNYALQTLGVFILWFGWYGFNCGSTLIWDGTLAGHIAVTTTLAPAAAGIVSTIITRVISKTWDLSAALNGVLGGLVGITAGCATTTPGAAICIGAIAGVIYVSASKFREFVLKIDDPVDAIAVHGFCGVWGLIAVALFSSPDLITGAGYHDCDSSPKELLKWQLLAAIMIFAWVSGWSIFLFGLLKITKQLKLSPEEQKNIDVYEHGGAAYEKLD